MVSENITRSPVSKYFIQSMYIDTKPEFYIDKYTYVVMQIIMQTS